MKLRAYLRKNNQTLKTFCMDNGFDYGYFRHVSRGIRVSPVLALKIENATKGKVTRLELLYP